ncbi:MAG: Type 11 methyltransferase [Candidatus Gottesmanbacteria bacterium GW2011_GWA2_47_9]|uniref:Type 11 methyltransferase n=1 Tax=Candidatus Gottesmanbacteria bacterium GW2011_GWA2_47_9 TaxID=1618445 RepID=A0A0G1U0T3_9BACT|nr:MAG: Type 11 methyltransferase [Candidatus Gottesmanbacteria bacterium GW2011_GWA2_47_9]
MARETDDQQGKITSGVQDFYQNLQTHDRNLRMAGGGDIINHHFGIGSLSAELPFSQWTQDQITSELYRLELAQIDYLITAMGDVSPGEIILDAGSGRGGTAFTLTDRLMAKVHGITIAPYQAHFAHELALRSGRENRAYFTVMNMLHLGYPREYFDRVITNETTMYFADDSFGDVFRQFFQVLKPGGTYTLATWCFNEKNQDAHVSVDPIDQHYRSNMQSLSAYKRALQDAGFAVGKILDLTQEAIPYWELRSVWQEASGVESHYLDGYREGRMFYIMLSAHKPVQI